VYERGPGSLRREAEFLGRKKKLSGGMAQIRSARGREIVEISASGGVAVHRPARGQWFIQRVGDLVGGQRHMEVCCPRMYGLTVNLRARLLSRVQETLLLPRPPPGSLLTY
jgi:hypothetical protein